MHHARQAYLSVGTLLIAYKLSVNSNLLITIHLCKKVVNYTHEPATWVQYCRKLVIHTFTYALRLTCVWSGLISKLALWTLAEAYDLSPMGICVMSPESMMCLYSLCLDFKSFSSFLSLLYTSGGTYPLQSHNDLSHTNTTIQPYKRIILCKLEDKIQKIICNKEEG